MNDKNLIEVLWSSNNVTAPSGYGTQTREFYPRFMNAGYGFALASNYGVQGAPYKTADGLLVLPSVIDAACNDILLGHFQSTKSDVLITLYDPHPYNPEVMKQMPWCSWTPIDSSPVVPGNVHALKAARWIWSMSRFGDEQLRAAGFQNVTYVPHGLDSTVFKPGNREESRRQLSTMTGVDLAGKFIVMMNSANKGSPSRKGFFEAFSAFKAFLDRHPDAMLYMHTEAMGAFAGENLPEIAALCGIDTAKVFYAPQYQLVCGMLGPEYMVNAYNAADVLLSTSHGEGFGLPIVEAQLCGTPVVVTRCSAMTELALTGQTFGGVEYMPVTGTRWTRPLVGGAIEALEWAYTQRGNEALRSQAREKALVYDAALVFDKYMLPAIQAIQADLYKPIEPQRVLRKRRKVERATGGVIAQSYNYIVGDDGPEVYRVHPGTEHYKDREILKNNGHIELVKGAGDGWV